MRGVETFVKVVMLWKRIVLAVYRLVQLHITDVQLIGADPKGLSICMIELGPEKTTEDVAGQTDRIACAVAHVLVLEHRQGPRSPASFERGQHTWVPGIVPTDAPTIDIEREA